MAWHSAHSVAIIDVWAYYHVLRVALYITSLYITCARALIFYHLNPGTKETTHSTSCICVCVSLSAVAICTRSEMEDFLSEAVCMKDFDHPNVMKLIGKTDRPTNQTDRQNSHNSRVACSCCNCFPIGKKLESEHTDVMLLCGVVMSGIALSVRRLGHTIDHYR